MGLRALHASDKPKKKLRMYIWSIWCTSGGLRSGEVRGAQTTYGVTSTTTPLDT
jgi:hypothetical protein